MRKAKVLSLDELLAIRRNLKTQGKTVVFTNGCFDIIHLGHIYFLRECKALGEILIVGINNDASVMKLKGQLRPIIPAIERAEIVSALEDVDYVTIFAELTPKDIIAALQPDIHCKGGDYADNSLLPESDVVTNYGGQVRLLSFLSNHSTSGIIQNIIKNYTNVNANSTDFSHME